MQIFTRTSHISERSLGAFVRTELPAADRELVVDHLCDCSFCQRQLKDVRQFISILGACA